MSYVDSQSYVTDYWREIKGNQNLNKLPMIKLWIGIIGH